MNKQYTFRFFLLLVFLGFALTMHAQQLKKFSGDSTRFIGELEQLFGQLSNPDQKIVEEGLNLFIQHWESDWYGPGKKQIIYRLGNSMLKKRMRTYPDIYQLLVALNVFASTNQSDTHFYDWGEILEHLGESKNSRHFLIFLEFSINLFRDDLVYHSASTEWKLETPRFQLFNDSVPRLAVMPTNLTCYANRDSLTIFETEGNYFPLDARWEGVGGRVDWQRAGLPPDQVYALLRQYLIQMKFSKYTADSVEFFNKNYLPSPLTGILMDKVQMDMEEENASYPQFYSYTSVIGIMNIFPGIDYVGGFSMQGHKVVGFGVKGSDALLTFNRNDKPVVSARSRTFIIRPDRISSAKASITIHHDMDSVYHPGLTMKYLNDKKELSLNKDERMPIFSPWFDTWHNVEIYCEAMYWNLNDSIISFEAMKGPATTSKAVFESSNYYSLDRYDRLRGIDDLNPLHIIKQYADKCGSPEFTRDALIQYWKKPPDQVENQLIRLSSQGYLIYDADDQRIVIKEKLINFVEASQKFRDYDEILFQSEVTGKSNAILNLGNFDMKLQGVPGVFLSDSQHVYVEPQNQELILKKNRDFVFSGTVMAGLFDFNAKDCSFDYDKFRINLPYIDTMEFYALSRTVNPETGKYPVKKVQTALNDLSGFLLIDDPDNKAGLKPYPDYPIFTNLDTARVNYDKPYIHKGAYNKEEFYFEVLPFTLASLDYVDTDSLKFDGSLVSAGILPDIPEPLKIRPDFSLGFEKQSDVTGFPVYGGKGTFVAKIDLSNQGLKGEGVLHYLTSTSGSDDFLFLPDSMKTLARGFVIREQLSGVEYPPVLGDSVREFWFPYQDSMRIVSTRKPIDMYNSQSSFNGALGLTPSGLSGEGTVFIEDAEMDSKGFGFRHHTFDALIANFRIRSYDLNELAISTRNYRTHFDFEERRGEFRSNLGISKMEFPVNKYVCSMDRFDWLIDQDEIMLTNESLSYAVTDSLNLSQLIDIGYTGTEFMSVHPQQDSLRFFALRARYNIRTNVINAEEVRIIKVADAAIYPDSGKVQILRNAVISPLLHANIIANTTNRFHNLYEATVQILGRKKYTGSGTLDYVDRLGNHQKIYFAQIKVDTAGNTTGSGEISETSGFNLSPEFAFTGDVTLFAPERELTYDGAFKPLITCYNPGVNWVRFKARINPTDIRLPVSDPIRNRSGEKLLLGLAYSTTENVIYPAFFTPARSFSDTIMIASTGVLRFNPVSSTYTTTKTDSMETGIREVSSVSLMDEECRMKGTGKINLGLNSGPLFLETYGEANHYILSDSTVFRLGIVFNFPFFKPVMEKIRNLMIATNLSGIQLFNSPYKQIMVELVGSQNQEKLQAELEMVGKFRRYPDELKKTLILADVSMMYDTVSHSFVSFGPIGVASIMDDMVNRYLKGKIEMTQKRSGDEFTIYLEISPNDWYFFNYYERRLQFVSSDLELNDRIQAMQFNKTEIKSLDKIWKNYRYSLSTGRKKLDFVRRHGIE